MDALNSTSPQFERLLCGVPTELCLVQDGQKLDPVVCVFSRIHDGQYSTLRSNGNFISLRPLSTLDDVLRTDLTTTAGDHPEIQRVSRRLRVLQWELKRTCLLEVMRGVAPGARATFILIRLFGFTPERMAAAFGVTGNSLSINLGRAEKTLYNYLSARCQHIEPSNACHCDTRLGVALQSGFVKWPEDSDAMPDAPVFAGTYSDASALYRSLPPFTPDPAALAALTAAQQSNAG